MTGRIIPYHSGPGQPPAVVYWHEHQHPDYILREVYLVRVESAGGLTLTYSHTERLIRGAKGAWYMEQATYVPPSDPGLVAGVVYAAGQALVAHLLPGKVQSDRGCVPVPAVNQLAGSGTGYGSGPTPTTPSIPSAVSSVIRQSLQRVQEAADSQPLPESLWQAVQSLSAHLRLTPTGLAAYAGGSVAGSITAIYRGGGMRSESLTRLADLARAYGWDRIAGYLERLGEGQNRRREIRGGW